MAMAYINREYDDLEIVKRIREIRPDISFGEHTRITDIHVDPPTPNSQDRGLEVKLVIPLSAEEFATVFSKAIA